MTTPLTEAESTEGEVRLEEDDNFGLRCLEFRGSQRQPGEVPTGCGGETLRHGSMGRARRRDWELLAESDQY